MDFKAEFKNIWSEYEVQYLADNYFNVDASDIAAHLGRTVISVKAKAKRLGLNHYSHLSLYEEHVIRSNLGRLSAASIAKLINCHQTTVSRYCRKHHLSTKVYGDCNPLTVHSDADVNLIVQLYDEGIIPTEIARKFEIPLPTIQKYIYKPFYRRVAADYYAMQI
ncbi:TPA: helix-turn-helix domain-containing protein [Klebsiella oxytoca]|uniref:Helix-turn-helix domain-containing protein n=1 Tax=Klebsiella oxytoca TaxID=571 RepID=A0AAN5RHB7_KLEOX|nr:helix-turn-helix domain-containing protein [Klebsiella oxytoca]